MLAHFPSDNFSIELPAIEAHTAGAVKRVSAAGYAAHSGLSLRTTCVISSHCGLPATNACSQSWNCLHSSAALSGPRASEVDAEAGSCIQTNCPARALRPVGHDFGSTRNSGRTCIVLPFTT